MKKVYEVHLLPGKHNRSAKSLRAALDRSARQGADVIICTEVNKGYRGDVLEAFPRYQCVRYGNGARGETAILVAEGLEIIGKELLIPRKDVPGSRGVQSGPAVAVRDPENGFIFGATGTHHGARVEDDYRKSGVNAVERNHRAAIDKWGDDFKAFCKKHDATAWVLAADFNLNLLKAALRRIINNELGNLAKIASNLPNVPTIGKTRQIDGFAVGGDWDAGKTEVFGKHYSSDHRGVKVQLIADVPDPIEEEDLMSINRTLTDLADVVRKSGLRVVELDGWEKNWSNGPEQYLGVGIHHTGSYDKIGDTSDDLSYAKWMAFTGRSDLPAPLCNLALSAEGVVYVCASGNANGMGTTTAGGGIPYRSGDDGNGTYIVIEAMNSGTQSWDNRTGEDAAGNKITQREAYHRLCSSLCVGYDWPNSRVRAHYETSVTGKWDPGDPNGISYKGSKVMDMTKFRAAVAQLINSPLEDDDMPLSEDDKKNVRDIVEKAVAPLRESVDALKSRLDDDPRQYDLNADLSPNNDQDDDTVRNVFRRTIPAIEAKLDALIAATKEK